MEPVPVSATVAVNDTCQTQEETDDHSTPYTCPSTLSGAYSIAPHPPAVSSMATDDDYGDRTHEEQVGGTSCDSSTPDALLAPTATVISDEDDAFDERILYPYRYALRCAATTTAQGLKSVTENLCQWAQRPRSDD